LGPTLEEFAGEHELPPRWLEVRRACTQLVERADFWHRADLRDAARRFAVEASDLFHSGLKPIPVFFTIKIYRRNRKAIEGMSAWMKHT